MAAAENPGLPVLFNPLKHHLNFIRKYIHNYSQKDYHRLKSDLLKVGDSQMDLYCGTLSISKITGEVVAFLKNSKLLEKGGFFRFIDQHDGFTRMVLSDQSTWILRKGESSLAFVHIHPARYSKHTIRIKAITLRSVIGAKIVFGNAASIGLSEMNEVRTGILGLSPIKNMGSATLKMLNMLSFTDQ